MKRLTKAEIASLLHQYKYEVQTDLMIDSYDICKYYLLENGQLLIDFTIDTFGLLAESKDALLQARKAITTGTARHILEGVIPDKKSFLRDLPEAPARLGLALNIPAAELDASFASLRLIDRQIHGRKISFQEYEKNLFPLLIPYLALCILKEKGGRLELYFDDEAKVWEPFVTLPGGKTVNVFIDLHDYAQEDFQNLSLFSIAHLRLDVL